MKWRSLEESAPDTKQRSLREIYAERKELIAKYVPVDIQAIHSRAVAELKQSGIAERTLQAGSEAPSFELSDHNGELVRSPDLLASGPLVVCFIRGRWCPFCVGQMEAMNAIYPQIKEAGASLVAISPQTVHQSSLMADQHKLGFPLLSDAGSKVAQGFGLASRVPDYQQEIYRRVFCGNIYTGPGRHCALRLGQSRLHRSARTLRNPVRPLRVGVGCVGHSSHSTGSTVLNRNRIGPIDFPNGEHNSEIETGGAT